MPSLDKGIVTQLKLASIAQAAPVQNTWYTVCDLKNITLNAVFFEVATATETIEVEFTVNGAVLSVGSQAATFGTGYEAYMLVSWQGNHYVSIDTNNYMIGYNQLPLTSFKVRIRKTTAAGAGTLSCAVSYNQC